MASVELLEVLLFEWDPKKAGQNARKHRITFEEAATVFGDSLSVTIEDTKRRYDEPRLVTIGLSQNGKLVVVVHTERADKIRMISARLATTHERKQYEEGT